jgi:DNA-binding GntR family transcriptional regulator
MTSDPRPPAPVPSRAASRRRRPGPAVPTRAEALATRLAQDIVAGLLPPGSALEEAALAQAHGVSRTPVREALRQLAATGLVEARPRRGAVVARPEPARLREIFAVMAELEALCAATCAAAMPPAARRDLARLHGRMAAMVRAGDVAAYRAANVDFHQALYAGTGNGFLAGLAGDTRRRVAPFRGAQLEAPDRLIRSHEEHGRILTAIERGDGAAAAAGMREHLALTEAAWAAMRLLLPGG